MPAAFAQEHYFLFAWLLWEAHWTKTCFYFIYFYSDSVSME